MERLSAAVVGYDRFVGERAYRQIAELYRALHMYVNCFQPSMKMQAKQRNGRKCDASTTQRRPRCSVCSCQASCQPRSNRNRPRWHTRLTLSKVESEQGFSCGGVSCVPAHHRTSSRLFCRMLFSGNASCREERPRSVSNDPHPVPRAGEEKTSPGLATHEDKILLKESGSRLPPGCLPTPNARSALPQQESDFAYFKKHLFWDHRCVFDSPASSAIPPRRKDRKPL